MARVLLALMMATFLSPSFSWHMHAEHHEIVAETQSADAHDHDGDAHASIGHVLGHLPMQMAQFEILIPTAEDVAPSANVSAPPLVSESSPPYRPPLTVRLA